VAPVSGTESDSDSILTPDVSSPLGHAQVGHGGGSHGGTSSQPPLSSIAERRSGSGEDSEDDEDEEEGGWKTADVKGRPQSSVDESVIKAGYLWKKGERRKVRNIIQLLFTSIQFPTLSRDRHGRNAGLCCEQPTWRIIKHLPNINYSAFSSFRTYIHARRLLSRDMKIPSV
jgi:hypothetical protein